MSGLAVGGTSVTITGTGFTGSSAVKFATTPATGYIITSGTQVVATSPAGSGTVDVIVTNPNGPSATSPADEFTYEGAPSVTAVSPVRCV